MLVCPDCQENLPQTPTPQCGSCDWSGHLITEVPSYYSSFDQNSLLYKDYFENYEKIATDDLEESILDIRYVENQAKNLADKIDTLDSKAICDLGSGQGFLVRELLSRGACEITAVDISTAYLTRFLSDNRIKPIHANAENLPFKNEFDIIVSTDVMEHVINLGSFLFSLNRALKLGGKAYIRVPYKENLLGYSKLLGCKYDFVHLRSFNKSLLKQTFVSAGFNTISFHLDGFSTGTPLQFWIKSQKRMIKYEKFRQWALNRIEHPSDVTTWNPNFARLFMEPQEIVCVIEKKREIPTQE